MARARNIKPSFFSNDELGELEPIARLLFIGLWTVADFKGCLEYRPKRLKAQILPYDNCNIEEIMINLEHSRFITIYNVQGQPYVKINNFEKHQNPHPNEKKGGSDIPDYVNNANAGNFSDIAKPMPERVSENIVINHDKDVTNHEQDGTNRADSLLLIPDSPILIPLLNTPPYPLASEGVNDEQIHEEEIVEQPKKRVSEKITLTTFIEHCRQNNEKPMSEYKALFDYAEQAKLPTEYINLCWHVFKREHLKGGTNERRRQKDWRRHFLNYVTKGYYKLWFAKIEAGETVYQLTTTGLQAQTAMNNHGEAA